MPSLIFFFSKCKFASHLLRKQNKTYFWVRPVSFFNRKKQFVKDPSILAIKFATEIELNSWSSLTQEIQRNSVFYGLKIALSLNELSRKLK